MKLKKTIVTLLMAVLLVPLFVPQQTEGAKTKTYAVNKTWKVPKQWKFKFTDAKTTEERNQYAAKAKQVIILKYNYENIGYKNDIMGLYISSIEMKVYDEKGVAAKTYPSSLETYPEELIVGTKCVGSEVAFALKNKSKKVTVVIEKYDSKHKKQTAKFSLKV